MLTLCNTEKAISEGSFFDLMYVNYENPTLNPHTQYAFLRECDGEVIVAIVNFGSRSADIRLNIPAHAFDVLGLKPVTEAQATELLTGEQAVKAFSSECPFEAAVEAHGAAIWKFKNLSNN